MCEPITIASIALTAAGAAAQMQGQRQARKAMGAANEAESLRQKKYTDESLSQFDQSLKYNSAQDQQQREQDAAGHLNDQFQIGRAHV